MSNFIGLYQKRSNVDISSPFSQLIVQRRKTETCASALQLSGGLCGCGKTVVMQLPDVLLQVKVAAKALTAGGTCEGLLVIVCVHVEGQVVDLMEGLVADGALVLLFPTVSQLVVLVVAWEIPEGIISMSEKVNMKHFNFVCHQKKRIIRLHVYQVKKKNQNNNIKIEKAVWM